MRRTAALALLALLAPACGGAAGAVGGGPKAPASDPAGLPDVAQVVCSDAGTRLVTPTVRARADGVHVEVRGLDDGHSFAWPGGGGGDGEQVLDLPPGPARVGCVGLDGDPVGRGLATLRVADPDAVWADDRLSPRCREQSTLTVDYVADADGMKLTPGNVRRAVDARPGDAVEAAGYPRAETRRFRLLRDGRVVAVGEFMPYGSGWLLDTLTSCA